MRKQKAEKEMNRQAEERKNTGNALPPHQNVGKVIDKVGRVLRELYKEPLRTFIIGGSFAAAIVAWHNFKVGLLYNDIDVFVQSREKGELSDDNHYRIQGDDGRAVAITNVRMLHGVLDGTEVPVNVVDVFDRKKKGGGGGGGGGGRRRREDSSFLGELIRNFDINAVMVGFRVQLDETYDAWKITAWEVRKPFLEFMASATLDIPEFRTCRSIVHSLVRLAKKSSELDLPMRLPSPDIVQEMMQSRAVPAAVVKKWLDLPRTIQNLPHFKDLSVEGPLEELWDGHRTEYYCFKRNKTTTPY